MLDGAVPCIILDAGAGSGRNRRLLSSLGHTVIALDNTLEEMRAGGLPPDVLGDVRRLPFSTVFDVALQNEVAQLLPSKLGAHRSLAELRRVTKPGGLNVVSGYLALPGRANLRNRARCFHPDELHDIYTQSGWNILYYEEDEQPNQYISRGAMQREIISSRAKIIARRP